MPSFARAYLSVLNDRSYRTELRDHLEEPNVQLKDT